MRYARGATRVLLSLLIAVAANLPARSGFAQAIVQIGVYADTLGSSRCIDADAVQPLRLYVVVTANPGAVSFTSVRFSYPTANCGVFLSGIIPVFPYTGVGNDFIVNFGTCLSPPIHVMTIEAYGMTRQDCCFVEIASASGTDCGGNEAGIIPSLPTLVDTICQYIPPAEPFPPDGASGVPTDVAFSWSASPGPNYCADLDWYGLSIGTAPDQLVVNYVSSDTFWDPPYLLEENVTYYWRVTVWGNGPAVESPVWSFSTAQPVTVEQSTWGRVKALYR